MALPDLKTVLADPNWFSKLYIASDYRTPLDQFLVTGRSVHKQPNIMPRYEREDPSKALYDAIKESIDEVEFGMDPQARTDTAGPLWIWGPHGEFTSIPRHPSLVEQESRFLMMLLEHHGVYVFESPEVRDVKLRLVPAPGFSHRDIEYAVQEMQYQGRPSHRMPLNQFYRIRFNSYEDQVAYLYRVRDNEPELMRRRNSREQVELLLMTSCLHLLDFAPETLQEWTAMLKSGDFKFGYGLLRSAANEYDALGVLADTMGLEWEWDEDAGAWSVCGSAETFTAKAADMIFDRSMSGNLDRKWLDRFLGLVMGTCDGSTSFREIATLLDEAQSRRARQVGTLEKFRREYGHVSLNSLDMSMLDSRIYPNEISYRDDFVSPRRLIGR